MAPPPPQEKITQGLLRTSDGLPLPLERTQVHARLTGPIADVEVQQTFHNPLDRAIEAVYLFPLPHGAAVHRLTFKLRSRTIEGVTKEREEAQRDYQRARAEGRAATLLEQDKPDLFTLSLANIAPGERILVTLGYQEKLAFDDGEYRFVFPMVAAERNESTSAQAPPLAPRRPRLKTPQERPADIGISVTLRAGVAIDSPRCPSHRVRASSFGVGSFTVNLVEEGRIPNRDFVLTYRPHRPQSQDPAPLVYLDRRLEKPGTFLLALTPPAEIAPTDTRPRDVVILVDRSCSMRGGSLAQARRAVRYLLLGLPEGDRAALIAFDHDRYTEPLTEITPDRIALIDGVLAALEPRGGTELEIALESAGEALPRTEGRTQIVVLLTDAAVGNEARLLRRAPELLTGARLYVLGIGPAVNRNLVERLARACGGASDVILPTEDIEPSVARFRRRVIQGGPVLTDLALSWEGAHPLDVYPQPIPDLFGGQPTSLVGRFAGAGPSRLVLTGKTATGAAYRREIAVQLPEEISEHPGLERLWARHRIDSRLDRLFLHPDEAADIRLEVLGLALKHSIASPYTSLVAVDPEAPRARSTQDPLRVDVPQGAPEGLEREVAAVERLMASKPRFESDGFEAPTGAAFASEGFGAPPEAPGFGPPPAFAPKPAAASAPMCFSDDEVERTIVASPRRAMMRHARAGSPPGGAEINSLAAVPQMQPIEADPYPDELLAWAAARPIGALDLVFLVDETGSMGAYISQVQQHILHILQAIKASPLCKSLRVGLVGYRDHPPQESTFVTRTTPLTEEVSILEQGVLAMQASGGGDGPEAVTDGLFDVVRLEWRKGATRTVIWIGDAPPHGVSPDGDGFPDGCPCGHHWYTQAESCREMGIILHAVACQPALSSYVGGEEVYRTVARAARGLYLPLSDAPRLIPLITGVAESDLDKQRIAAVIEEMLRAHREELGPLDEEDRVERLTALLRRENVRPRSLEIQGEGLNVQGALRFREISEEDVEAGLSDLRREGREGDL